VAAIYPDLQGKVVLVTGGGSGIGEAIVREFARQKAKVAFIDIAVKPSRELIEKLSAEGAVVHFEQCDLTNITALRDAVGAIKARMGGAVQVLINNAAHDERHSTQSVTEEFWDSRVAVNLKHQFFCSQAVLPDMQSAGSGVIVNMGSTSWMIGQGGMAAYTACKAGVVGLTRSLARDYGQFGIRVNAVAPGWTMTQRQLEKWVTPEGEAQIMERQCLKRKLQPVEVARFVVFLASDDASACTNQQYVVDAGWL
jgi:NAD(P)-dependent dehydrogenase (short-subunit alcohol dehydrogenase family)